MPARLSCAWAAPLHAHPQLQGVDSSQVSPTSKGQLPLADQPGRLALSSLLDPETLSSPGSCPQLAWAVVSPGAAQLGLGFTSHVSPPACRGLGARLAQPPQGYNQAISAPHGPEQRDPSTSRAPFPAQPVCHGLLSVQQSADLCPLDEWQAHLERAGMIPELPLWPQPGPWASSFGAQSSQITKCRCSPDSQVTR